MQHKKACETKLLLFCYPIFTEQYATNLSHHNSDNLSKALISLIKEIT